MSPLNSICRIGTFISGSNRNILFGRITWFSPNQICNFTKKSAEEMLGIEKPKRPLTPFFKFMNQMRPALLAKNPGITPKEAIVWSSKHWQELDSETKSQMIKEYEKDFEDYKKIKKIYESSLTDQQKADIKRVKEEMAAAKEKRRLKAEYKELGRPKKPMSSYFLYTQSRKDTFNGKESLVEYQKRVKADWLRLPESERAKFEKEAQELMNKYKKDLEAWKLKMVSIGRTDLVPSKPVRQKVSKKVGSE